MNWKSSHVVLQRILKKSYNSEISHLKIFDCKAYSLLKEKDVSSKSEKLVSRTFVYYLIEYDSTNIFRVWNLEIWSISDYKNMIFDENQTFFINTKKNIILEKKMIEFVKLKVFDLVSYIVDLIEDDERWSTIVIRNRFVVSSFSIVDESSSALNVLASMSAKNVFIILSQSSLSTLETTSSFQSESASIFSSSLTRDKRAIKDSLSLSNDLSEIDRTSLDIAELVDLSRNIDSSNLKVSNIVEEKRVRKSKKIANLAVVSLLDIYSSLEISFIDIVVSKNANSNEMKNIYSTFAVITKSTRLHRDSLLSFSKLWRDMLRHSHVKDF
jgi:hypothetical protein